MESTQKPAPKADHNALYLAAELRQAKEDIRRLKSISLALIIAAIGSLVANITLYVMINQ